MFQYSDCLCMYHKIAAYFGTKIVPKIKQTINTKVYIFEYVTVSMTCLNDWEKVNVNCSRSLLCKLSHSK